MSSWNFVLSWVEHEQSFITSGQIRKEFLLYHLILIWPTSILKMETIWWEDCVLNPNLWISIGFLFVLILYIPVNIFSVILWWVFLGWTSTKQRIKSLAHGQHSASGEARTRKPQITNIPGDYLDNSVIVYDKLFAEDSKQIVPDQTAPLGAVWSGTLLFAHGFPVYVIWFGNIKVSKGAKIRNRYNQVPHLTQDTNGKVTNS